MANVDDDGGKLIDFYDHVIGICPIRYICSKKKKNTENGTAKSRVNGGKNSKRRWNRYWKYVSSHQSLGLVGRDDGDLVRRDGPIGGVFVSGDGFMGRGRRTVGAGELHVKYVRHFSDEREPAGQFPADFLRLFLEPLRLGLLLLRHVVHGTRAFHRGGGGARRSRREETRNRHE